jgi:hypothetical protein
MSNFLIVRQLNEINTLHCSNNVYKQQNLQLVVQKIALDICTF